MSGDATRADGRVCRLSDAVLAHVRPGMHLHFASTPSRSNAAVREVARAFFGRRPGFKLSSTGFHSMAHLLPMLRLADSLAGCFFGDHYPAPRPNPLYTRLAASGVAIEQWSLLSLVASLRAGAQGDRWAVNRSLAGTSIAEELAVRGAYREVADPCDPSRTIGLCAAMRPDITFVHAAAGDEDGNVIASAPMSEGMWSALAARRGVIVTVEAIAPRAWTRAHPDLITLPPHRVLAVCEEPFGAHPQPFHCAPSVGVASYRDDFEHYDLWRTLTTDEAGFARVVDRLLRAPDGGEAYRAMVGPSRLERLRVAASRRSQGRARTPIPAPALSVPTPVSTLDGPPVMRAASLGALAALSGGPVREVPALRGPPAGSPVAAPVEPPIDAPVQPLLIDTVGNPVEPMSDTTRTAIPVETSTPMAFPRGLDPSKLPQIAVELLLVLAARRLAARARALGSRVVLAGIGQAFLAARLAQQQLAADGYQLRVMVETGLYDVECGPTGHGYLLSYDNIAQARRLSSIDDILGVLACGADNHCLAALGAAQIDRQGNLNSTRLRDGRVLVGSGGACDIAASVEEVVVLTRLVPGRLVDRLDYVTSPGRAVRSVATDRGVLARRGGRWVLEALAPAAPDTPVAEQVARIRRDCPWPFEVPPGLTAGAWITDAEARLLAALDPDGSHRQRSG